MPVQEEAIGLREKARLRRLSDITAAAQSLFAEKAYEQITTREIAERAGVGEATLFRYFSSKAELLLMVVGNRIGRLVDQLEADDGAARRTDGRSYLDRIHHIYDERSKMYVSDPENIRAFALEGVDSVSELVPPHSMSQGDRVIELIARILTEGQLAGVIREDADVSTVAMNCNGTYVHEVIRSPSRNLEPSTFAVRLRKRLDAQLIPLFLDV